eukprot:TRINITY_DN14474_c0_g1_i2.p1 TRINITY_DN14474_c0_g1~~TRINITY_DN14474_c0_g1_i2.p1  ORF type:complete len:732 (-),score=124.59 TRINITY_DN14474_c0_g1_i2:52-2247(-)
MRRLRVGITRQRRKGRACWKRRELSKLEQWRGYAETTDNRGNLGVTQKQGEEEQGVDAEDNDDGTNMEDQGDFLDSEEDASPNRDSRNPFLRGPTREETEKADIDMNNLEADTLGLTTEFQELSDDDKLFHMGLNLHYIEEIIARKGARKQDIQEVKDGRVDEADFSRGKKKFGLIQRDLEILRESTVRFGKNMYKPKELFVPDYLVLDMIEEHRAAGYITRDINDPLEPHVKYPGPEIKRARNVMPETFDQNEQFQLDPEAEKNLGYGRGRLKELKQLKLAKARNELDEVRRYYELDVESRSSLLGLGSFFETEGERFHRTATEVNSLSADNLRAQSTVKMEGYFGNIPKPPGDRDRSGELRDYNKYLANYVDPESEELYEYYKALQPYEVEYPPEEETEEERKKREADEEREEEKILKMAPHEQRKARFLARLRETSEMSKRYNENSLFVKMRRKFIYDLRGTNKPREIRADEDEQIIEEYLDVKEAESAHPELSANPIHELVDSNYIQSSTDRRKFTRILDHPDNIWRDPLFIDQQTGEFTDDAKDYAMNVIFDSDEVAEFSALQQKYMTKNLKFAADEPDPSATKYTQLVDSFMSVMLKTDRLGYKWFCNPVSAPEMYRWYDPVWTGGLTRLPMASYSPKIRRSITIDWRSWKMLIQEEDMVKNHSKSRTVDVPSDWLLAFKKVAWPSVRDDSPPTDFDAYYPATRARVEICQYNYVRLLLSLCKSC